MHTESYATVRDNADSLTYISLSTLSIIIVAVGVTSSVNRDVRHTT